MSLEQDGIDSRCRELAGMMHLCNFQQGPVYAGQIIDQSLLVPLCPSTIFQSLNDLFSQLPAGNDVAYGPAYRHCR